MRQLSSLLLRRLISTSIGWNIQTLNALKHRTQTTEGTGINHPTLSGDKLMNTLNLIRNQIKKQAALHDAQIAVTSYRGVRYECQQGAEEVHGTFCYRGHTYNK
jgi:hypothetical protein